MNPSGAAEYRFTAPPRQVAGQRLAFREWLTFPTLLSLTAGLLTNIQFQFGGKASVGELVLAVIALFSVISNLGRPKFWNRRFCLVLLMLATTFAGYIISDLINGTPSDRLMRGWARIAFVIIDFIAIWALTRNSVVNLFALCVGDAFSSIMTYGQENGGFLYNYKFHLSQPITVFVMIAVPLTFRKRPGLATGIAMVGLGIAHLLLDNRVGGAVCILIGFVLTARDIGSTRFRSLSLGLLALAVVIAAFATALLYESSNLEFATRRQESNSFRLASALAGISAIERSPIFGLGSWVWDADMYNEFSAHVNRNEIAAVSGAEALSSHSQVIQVWSEAGLLGITFFVYYGLLLFRVLWILFFKRQVDLMMPLFLYNILIATWHLFFSPFANLHRFLIALAVLICIQVIRDFHARPRLPGKLVPVWIPYPDTAQPQPWVAPSRVS